MLDFEIGKQFELRIERLGIYGEGVGHAQGFTLFVEGALPGERVVVTLYELRKTYGRASIVKVVEPSIHRVVPVCPAFGECGGCQLLHLTYSGQLEMKRQRVVDALERIGNLHDCFVAPCTPSPFELGYRNKIQLPCSKENPVQLGLYARKTHDLVQIDKCYIHCAQGEEVFAQVQRLLKEYPCAGVFKHVLIKTSVKTGQVLLILVTAEREVPFLSSFAEEVFKRAPRVRGIVQNINPKPGNVILSEEFHLIGGESFIEEEILGYQVKISAASFFQVNTLQAEQLYARAVEMCGLTGGEKVVDAYCGVGVLSLVMSKHALEVVGIECVEDAVTNAQENAERNQVANVRFICAPVEGAIESLSGVDVVLLNPPRKGCDPIFLEAVVKCAPKRIVYISCDPATFARDLKFLSAQGYKLEEAYPFDMFPQTAHVECVGRLSKTL